MIEIKNTYEDRDITVTVRDGRTGQDGPANTVAAGQSANVEIDGDYQIALSTRPREPGEAPLEGVRQANLIQDGPGGQAGGTEESPDGPTNQDPQLNEGTDDQVSAEIKAMVDEKANLTSGGKPELPELNKRLEAKGIAPVDGKRRDALMPQA